MHPIFRALLQSDAGPRWRARRWLGAGLFLGMVAGFSGYALSGNGWWFLAPLIGYVGASRVFLGHWPWAAPRD